MPHPNPTVPRSPGVGQPSAAVPELTLERSRRRSRPWESGASDAEAPVQLRPRGPLPRRWDRLVRLVGDDGASRLVAAHVCVVGLEGVGGYLVESLARSAVGQLTLVDFDDVCVTNVNRQIQAFLTTVGQSKSALLAERVRAINPDANVRPLQAFYDASTAEKLLTPSPDFVVDAIDNVTAKLDLITRCLQLRIPIVSISGAGARWDPTRVRVADLSETRGDPLARTIRKELARRGVDTAKHVGVPVVFSEEAVQPPEVPVWDEAEGFRCICPHQEDSPHACEKRRVIYGTASFVTSAFAAAAASVVVRALCETAP